MKIFVGVCGSIAAYRSVDFLRALKAQGHDLQVVLTRSAEEFVSRKVLETFLGDSILSNDIFDVSHSGTEHIAVAKWADAVLVYGATAHFLAQYRAGLAGDFLLAQLLAFDGDVYLMPAMNPTMWAHPSTQESVSTLKDRDVHFLGPIAGRVACGDEGIGHLIAHEEVLSLFKEEAAASAVEGDESLPKVLLSMGPMRTQIDPVRYMQNESSGLMGMELIRAFIGQGILPTVLLGPVDSEVVDSIRDMLPASLIHRYKTSEDYEKKMNELAAQCDLFFSAAAILDFEFEEQKEKLDRRDADFSNKWKFLPVKDFAKEFSRTKTDQQWLVSFSAEVGEDDQDILSRALAKKNEKSAEWTLVNRVSDSSGPSKPQSDAWILDDEGRVEFLGEELSKTSIAQSLVLKVKEAWSESHSIPNKSSPKPLSN